MIELYIAVYMDDLANYMETFDKEINTFSRKQLRIVMKSEDNHDKKSTDTALVSTQAVMRPKTKK